MPVRSHSLLLVPSRRQDRAGPRARAARAPPEEGADIAHALPTVGFPEEGAADGAGGAADVLTDWAQLHEAQQKVQEADTERIANEDRRSTTRVGDMTWRSCLDAGRLPSALPAEVVRLSLVTWDSTGAVERGLGQDAAHRTARGEPDQIAPRRAFWSSNQKARRGGYVHSHWHGGPLGMGWSCVGLWFGHSLVSRVGRGLNIGLVTDWSSQVGHGMLIGWPLFLRGLVGFAM